MKKIVLSAALLVAVATGALAQGTVTFANIGSGLNSPFTLDGVRIAGSTISVELLAGSDAGSLDSIGVFTPTFNNGYFNAGTQTIGNITGNTATFVVRAWSTAAGATYDAAFGLGATAISNPFVTQVQTDSQLTPLPLVGLQALNLVVVPEPSVIALAVLGAGALFFRRKKA